MPWLFPWLSVWICRLVFFYLLVLSGAFSLVRQIRSPWRIMARQTLLIFYFSILTDLVDINNIMAALKTNPIFWVARIIPQGTRQYWTSLDTTIQADWSRFLITHHLDRRFWIWRLPLRYMVNHGTQSQVFSNRCTPQS